MFDRPIETPSPIETEHGVDEICARYDRLLAQPEGQLSQTDAGALAADAITAAKIATGAITNAKFAAGALDAAAIANGTLLRRAIEYHADNLLRGDERAANHFRGFNRTRPDA